MSLGFIVFFYSLVCSQLIGLVKGTGAVVEYEIESVEG
jgi:hypothetical protein